MFISAYHQDVEADPATPVEIAATIWPFERCPTFQSIGVMTSNLEFEHRQGLQLARIGAAAVGAGIRASSIPSFIRNEQALAAQ